MNSGTNNAFDSLRWCDSYSRMPTLVDIYFEADSRLEWFRRLGIEWDCCDNIWACKKFLIDVLSDANRAELDAMMDSNELAEFSNLPDVVTIYRGCYSHNLQGLSWSLSRDVASKFPFYTRYRHSRKPAFLLTGRVRRNRAVLKLNRNERELIAPRVRIVAREKIKNPA